MYAHQIFALHHHIITLALEDLSARHIQQRQQPLGSVMAKSEELSGEQKVSPLRWCSITSVYTPLSTALFLLFKCLSISLTQHYFTVSCTKFRWGVIWAPGRDQPGATESVIALLFPASGARHLRHSCRGSYAHLHTYVWNCSYTLSGQRGDGWSVGAVSITADKVCHHHNGVGFKICLRQRKESSLQLGWRKLV